VTGSWFPVPDEGDLPDDLRKLFAKARERLGFVPNVFAAYAFRPDRLRAWFTHFKAVHEPTDGLTSADRELIAGQALREELGDPVLGERIAFDWRRAGLDERRTAIAAYAEKLTLTPRDVGEDDLRSLLDVGLTTEEAWDVAEVASMYNFTNRMAMATNMLPNEEYSGLSRSPAPG
jgi:alkylhydroperoxidase family enzyme